MSIKMRNLSITQWSILLIPHITMYDRILNNGYRTPFEARYST